MNSGQPPPPILRLAHLSDIHLCVPTSHWTARDWLSKRLTGWIHLSRLGRGRRFRDAERVLQALDADLRETRPEHLVFSGDATALGFPEEVYQAARLLPLQTPGLAVPGNHDYYTALAAASGAFERAFSPWQVGRRLGADIYPFAQRVAHAWLIAVNSAQANWIPWDATGAVGPAQRERLEALLATLAPGPRILVTHYPVRLADGTPEASHRRLTDLGPLLDVAERGGICLWLHGHRHGAYHLADPGLAPFPVICSGSATQEGRWSYGVYTLTGLRLRVERRVFDATAGAFRPGAGFELDLPVRGHTIT